MVSRDSANGSRRVAVKAQATAFDLPAILEGTISHPGDIDHFRFRAKAGQKLAFEVHAPLVGPPHFNPRLELMGYLVSRFKRARAYQRSYLEQLRTHFGPKAFDVVIPDLAQFEKSVTDRIPITLHARRSEEADIARQFFTEVEQRIQRLSPGGTGSGRPDLRRRALVAA